MSRLFVIDPVCAMEYGHSLNALKYFAQMVTPYFDETVMVASRHLPGETAQDGIERFFEFHYGHALRIVRRAGPRAVIAAATNSHGPRASSTADFMRLLQKYDMTSADTLLFPSIDYYAALGILAALTGRPAAQQPRLMIRLIGVMETAAIDLPAEDALSALVAQIKLYARDGGAMTLCAETPKYARKMTKMLGLPVLTVPYFSPVIEAIDMPAGPVTFLAGGSARPDKGFFRLGSIIRHVHARIPPRQVRFVIQGLPDDMTQDNLDYVRALHALPNTKILPGQISYDEIKASFAQTHVSLMPYDRSIYAMRGSAMLMESMLFGRLVVAQAGTAFADQARSYSAGAVCDTDDDFADAICAYAGMAPARLQSHADLARRYYLEDVDMACKAWVEGVVA